jgi:hypothetical protein
MPCSFFAWTSSLIFATTRSGPTLNGSSVTMMPLRRAVMFSMTALARMRKVPRPRS